MTSPYFARPSTRSAAAKALAAFTSVRKIPKQEITSSSSANNNDGSQAKYPIKVENDKVIKQEIKLEHSDNVEYETDAMKNDKKQANKRKNKTPKVVSPKKEKPDGRNVADDWEPQNWRKVLANIKEMRKDLDAPVDSQGCERTADDDEKPEIIRFQILVSLMLSAQTKDQITFAAMEKLKEHGLNPKHVLKTDEKVIGELIYPVGFWKRKAKYIKQATEICLEKYNGDIPDTLEGLLALPGVGPKMAHICMHAAWKKMTGIGVDTHVHRISNRLGWVKKTTKTPEDTRKALESWLPREEWESINVLLVGFGQQTCLPVKPKCGECLAKMLCPYGKSATRGNKQ